MLVLSRKRDEIIQIGDDIQITVVDIRGDKIRLGITAPKGTAVHRAEIYREIQRMARQLTAKAAATATAAAPSIPSIPSTTPTERKPS